MKKTKKIIFKYPRHKIEVHGKGEQFIGYLVRRWRGHIIKFNEIVINMKWSK